MAKHELRVSYEQDDHVLESVAQTLGMPAEDVLARLARAALDEYLLAFAGERSPTTIRDLRELRLALLYRHLPGPKPTDQQVSELFQLTRTQAAGLIAGVRARYRGELDERLRAEAWKAVESGEELEGEVLRVELPDSLAVYVKDLIRSAGVAAPQRSRDSSRKYDLSLTMREELEAQLGDRPPGA